MRILLILMIVEAIERTTFSIILTCEFKATEELSALCGARATLDIKIHIFACLVGRDKFLSFDPF